MTTMSQRSLPLWVLLKGREICISRGLVRISWINLDGAGGFHGHCICLRDIDGLRVDLIRFVIVETRLVHTLLPEIDDAIKVGSRRQISAESVRTLVPVRMGFCIVIA